LLPFQRPACSAKQLAGWLAALLGLLAFRYLAKKLTDKYQIFGQPSNSVQLSCSDNLAK
jgi:hypothetical protein